MRKSNSRGFTLVELSVTIAVVAIIATAIVTFTTLMSARVSLNRSYYQAAADADYIRTCLDRFIYGFQGGAFSVSEDNSRLGYGGEEGAEPEFYAECRANVFYLYTGEEPFTYRPEGEMSLAFSVTDPSASSDQFGQKQFITCKIHFSLERAETDFVYCFTVYGTGGGA